MARKRFLTPADIPETEVCRGLVMPASQDWLGVFSEALSQTIYAYNYEQIHETDLTPEQAAAEAYARYVAWLDATCEAGEPCALPDGKRIIRRGTDGRFQEYNGTDWQALSGEYAPPAPAPRSEATDALKKCGAASNAAEVLRNMYEHMTDFYQTEVDPALNAIEWATWAGVTIASAFGPISAAWIELFAFAWQAFTSALAFAFEDVWTTSWHSNLVCILEKTAIVNGNGSVTWNIETLNAELVGLIIPIVDSFTQARWQTWYMVQIIGEEGLEVSGGKTTVGGSCVSCSTDWRLVYDFRQSAHGFSTTEPAGYWQSGVGWRGTINYFNGSSLAITRSYQFSGTGSVSWVKGFKMRLQTVYSGPTGTFENGQIIFGGRAVSDGNTAFQSYYAGIREMTGAGLLVPIVGGIQALTYGVRDRDTRVANVIQPLAIEYLELWGHGVAPI